MKMLRAGLVLALACCGASGAKADWNYTKWGMTPQQVISASNNLAKQGSDLHPDSDGNVSKLIAPYKSGKFAFEAQFGFDAANKLSSVTLVLTDKSSEMDMESMDMHGQSMKMDAKSMNMDQATCHDLQEKTAAAYGPPQGGGSADMVYTIQTWQDQKSGNNVKYTVLYGTGCYIQYSVIKPSGAH